jgi:hypothetical protein
MLGLGLFLVVSLVLSQRQHEDEVWRGVSHQVVYRDGVRYEGPVSVLDRRADSGKSTVRD